MILKFSIKIRWILSKKKTIVNNKKENLGWKSGRQNSQIFESCSNYYFGFWLVFIFAILSFHSSALFWLLFWAFECSRKFAFFAFFEKVKSPRVTNRKFPHQMEKFAIWPKNCSHFSPPFHFYFTWNGKQLIIIIKLL